MLRAAALFAAVAAVFGWLALAPRAPSARAAGTSTTRPPAAATLEECVTAPVQAERSATFSGEMSALPGSAKMQMRIDVLERQPGAPAFHVINAAGLGVWRTAATGVKTYKYLKQVTNLAAPAYYRADVRFRWLNSKGKLIHAAELRTARCLQTVPAGEEGSPGETPPKSA